MDQQQDPTHVVALAGEAEEQDGRPLVTLVSVGGERWQQFADRFPFAVTYMDVDGVWSEVCERCGALTATHDRTVCPGGRDLGTHVYPPSWVATVVQPTIAELVARMDVRLGQLIAQAAGNPVQRQALKLVKADLAMLGLAVVPKPEPRPVAPHPTDDELAHLEATIAQAEAETFGLDDSDLALAS